MSHNIALNGKIYNDIREIKVPLAEDTLTYKSYVANEGALTVITADSAENLPSVAEEHTIAFVPASSNTESSAVGNVHIIDIGDKDLNIEDLDLAAYKEGDVLLIIQNQDQNQS